MYVDYPEKYKRFIYERLGIDIRGLAVFRIFLGILLILNLVLNIRGLSIFYSDSGVLPRDALFEKYSFISNFSIHALSGEVWFQALIFVFSGIFAFSLIIGYKTKISSFMSFFLLLSLNIRNPLILNAGDILFIKILFWSIFLPLGNKWSIDSIKNKKEVTKKQIVSIGSAGLLLEVFFIYFIDSIFKFRSGLWFNGEGLVHAFSIDRLTILFGELISQYPSLIRILGIIWFFMLSLSFLLILFTGLYRIIFVTMFIFAHITMAFTMYLGLFPWISIVSLIPFMPAQFWDEIENKISPLKRKTKKLGIYLNSFLPKNKFNLSFSKSKYNMEKKVISLLLLSMIFLTILWNIMSLGYIGIFSDSTPIKPENNGWSMFSSVNPIDKWYTAPGKLKSGKKIYALQQKKTINKTIEDTENMYPSHKWMLYLTDISKNKNSNLLPHLADYICKRWNTKNSDKLINLTIYKNIQFNDIEKNSSIKPIKTKLITYKCKQPKL